MRKHASFFVLLSCLGLFPTGAVGGRRHRTRTIARVPRGCHELQKLQNLAVKPNRLPRFRRFEDLAAAIRDGRLVRIRDTASYGVGTVGSLDPANAESYAYAQPWVRSFLDTELPGIAARYGRFKITSLVRTQAYQRSLCRNRGEGATCGSVWWRLSSHLTGSTVDISMKDLDPRAAALLERRLWTLRRQGKVIAIKESDCYHIMVLRSYDRSAKAPKRTGRHTRHKRHRARH